MGTLTTFGEVVMGVVISAVLAGIGTIGWSQFHTNRNFNSFILNLDKRLDVFITLVNERDKNQQVLCDIHQDETCELKKTVNVAISKLNVKIDYNQREIQILKTKVK